MVVERLSPHENEAKFPLGNRLSDEASAFFNANGFVVFEQLFGQEERDHILDAVDAVVESLPPDHPDLQMGIGWDGKPRPGRTYHVVIHSESINHLALEDERLQLMSTLCPGEHLLMANHKSGVVLQDKSSNPDSGFKGLRWHDDWDSPPYGRILTVGIYFDRSTQANGAMRVVPGTQDIDRGIAVPDDTDVHPDEVALVAEPGDVTVHINGLWHCSPLGWMDGSEGRRRVLYFTFAERLPENPPLAVPPGYREKIDL